MSKTAEVVGTIILGIMAIIGVGATETPLTIAKLLTCIACLAGVGLLLAFPIKWTWNTTMPYLFALPTITWGKAWCLNFLCGCLIKASQSNTNKSA